VTPSLRIHALAGVTFLITVACAHQATTTLPPFACADEKVALRIAQGDVRQTGRAEGTAVTIDEERTSYDEGRASWRFWLLVGNQTELHKAFLYVRRTDCSTNWGPFLYEM
jgi:hypothetical protein